MTISDDKPVLRGPKGQLLPGTAPIGHGGLSRRQAAIVRLLEGATPKAIRNLVKLLDSPTEAIQLGAIKEVLARVARPPPRRKVETNTTVNVAVNTVADGRERAVLIAKLRAHGLNPAEFLPSTGAPALAAPEIIDVAVEEVDPAEEGDPEDDDDTDEGAPI